jgi:hypothetical protein
VRLALGASDTLSRRPTGAAVGVRESLRPGAGGFFGLRRGSAMLLCLQRKGKGSNEGDDSRKRMRTPSSEVGEASIEQRYRMWTHSLVRDLPDRVFD